MSGRGVGAEAARPAVTDFTHQRTDGVQPLTIAGFTGVIAPHPGCDLPASWCDLHHVVHRGHGGPSTSTNGVCLCGRHHTFLHRRPQWRATFEHQHLRVFRPDGTELDPDPWKNDDSYAGAPDDMNPVTLTLPA